MSPLRYLLDTNICIYIAKQRPPSVAARFAKLAAGSVGMSLITFGELRYGAEKSSQRAQALDTLSRLEALIPVITPDDAVGERYGVIRAYLERAGTPIGNNDLWIAAHALSLGVTLISNNTREFERVPKLKLDNWVEQPHIGFDSDGRLLYVVHLEFEAEYIRLVSARRATFDEELRYAD